MPANLAEILRAEIAARGSIPFRDFMEWALYHPEHGYYTSGRAEIGRRGDFFTNISVGPLFGKLLAREFATRWRSMGEPSEFVIVEQGAGGGDFAADVLAELRACSPACLAATRYRMVEPSSLLARRQRERLAQWPVEWSPSLASLRPFTGIHFSNELPDSFPVHLVRWTGAEWVERSVTLEKGALAFVDTPFSSPAVAAGCAKIPLPLPPGYTTEVNLAAPQWIRDVADKLVRGSVIVVDYGYPRADYYAMERMEGTLTGYAHHHRIRDVLTAPGQVDLTAHVDFTSLIEAGESAGLRVAEFTDQHRFVTRLGIEYFAGQIEAGERRAFMTLMHPQFMGSAFKVLRMEKHRPPRREGPP